MVSTPVQIIRYGSVGLLNTAITFVVIAVLTYTGQDPFVANAVGFGAGLANSFFMNRRFTFAARPRLYDVLPFIASFAIAYGCNIVVLYAAISLASIAEMVPQMIGMAAYNIVFFVLMKSWVFRDA